MAAAQSARIHRVEGHDRGWAAAFISVRLIRVRNGENREFGQCRKTSYFKPNGSSLGEYHNTWQTATSMAEAPRPAPGGTFESAGSRRRSPSYNARALPSPVILSHNHKREVPPPRRTQETVGRTASCRSGRAGRIPPLYGLACGPCSNIIISFVTSRYNPTLETMPLRHVSIQGRASWLCDSSPF